jgi:hypothetical protein
LKGKKNMKKTAFLRWLKPVLIMSLACSLVLTAAAQNYYPADIGNTWVFESVDGAERSTYTLEGPEIIDGQERILLKISTEELSTGEVDTDRYFLSVGNEAIELHRTIFELVDPPAIVTADFPTPVTFFPLQLELGDKWQIAADAEAKLEIGLDLSGKSVTDLEVVGFEDVITPVGTFENCAKVQLDLNFTVGGFLNIDSNTHQWFAPDVGPVQFENSDGLLFSLVSSNLLTVPEEPDITEEDSTPEPPPEEDAISELPPEEDAMPEPSPYDVTGDGIVNILDLTFVASRFGESDSDADVTGDGVVNVLDLVLIAQNLGN